MHGWALAPPGSPRAAQLARRFGARTRKSHNESLSLIETLVLALVLTPTLVMLLSWEALVVTLTPTSHLVLGFTIALITALAVAPTGYGRLPRLHPTIRTGGENSKLFALELRSRRMRAPAASSVPSVRRAVHRSQLISMAS